MSEFKGTKGIWEAIESYDNKYDQACININSNGVESLATVWSGGSKINQITLQDAKIIAAAPEMLEMLKKIYITSESMGLTGNINHYEIEQLIKKATEL